MGPFHFEPIRKRALAPNYRRKDPPAGLGPLNWKCALAPNYRRNALYLGKVPILNSFSYANASQYLPDGSMSHVGERRKFL